MEPKNFQKMYDLYIKVFKNVSDLEYMLIRQKKSDQILFTEIKASKKSSNSVGSSLKLVYERVVCMNSKVCKTTPTP